MTDRSITARRFGGADNTFLVIDRRTIGESTSTEPTFLTAGMAIGPIEDVGDFAANVCAETGVDGVLYVGLMTDSTPPRVSMSLLQPDGEAVEMCGNGARCVVAWAHRITGSSTIDVQTPIGNRRGMIFDDTVEIEMGTPSFEPDAVPTTHPTPMIGVSPRALFGDSAVNEVDGSLSGWTCSAVTTGVPHAVCLVPDVESIELDDIAPPLRHAAPFPEGTNITVASQRPDGFAQRTFERGVEAETAACGTGAVAIAAVVREIDRDHKSSVSIYPPGGHLNVRFESDGSMALAGPIDGGETYELAVDGREVYTRG